MFARLLILASVCYLCIAGEDKCDQGSDYWCQNYGTATECGVLEYCKRNSGNFMTKNDAEPVVVELYYESLCGGCRIFMMSQLYPTYSLLKDTDILDIKLYPYGNAEESQSGGKWKFQCQHGAVECQVNLIETCALHMMTHPTQFMPYIHCVKSNPSMDNAKKCADQLQIEWGPIESCYNGDQGNHLEHEMAIATGKLDPPHQYVPWIVGNGKHTEPLQSEMQTNLLAWVCKTYKGTQPKECRSHEEQRCNKKKGNEI